MQFINFIHLTNPLIEHFILLTNLYLQFFIQNFKFYILIKLFNL